MGLAGPKSTIVVKDRKNYLELIFEQIEYINKKYNVNGIFFFFFILFFFFSKSISTLHMVTK
jgi:UDP-N-acetylglucosamine pyrophosphorylase